METAMGYRLANVNGRAALVEGEEYYDLGIPQRLDHGA